MAAFPWPSSREGCVASGAGASRGSGTDRAPKGVVGPSWACPPAPSAEARSTTDASERFNGRSASLGGTDVGPITGAALNPAREFGPNLVQTLIGGTAKWDEFWVYVLGPIGGGLLGSFAYEAIGKKRAPATERTAAVVAERA